MGVWPRRKEPLRGLLLSFAHCLLIITHGVFQWQITDKRYWLPCFPAALHLVACQMPIISAMHGLSLLTALVITLCLYHSLFDIVMASLLLLVSVGLSITSAVPGGSPTTTSQSNASRLPFRGLKRRVSDCEASSKVLPGCTSQPTSANASSGPMIRPPPSYLKRPSLDCTNTQLNASDLQPRLEQLVQNALASEVRFPVITSPNARKSGDGCFSSPVTFITDVSVRGVSLDSNLMPLPGQADPSPDLRPSCEQGKRLENEAYRELCEAYDELKTEYGNQQIEKHRMENELTAQRNLLMLEKERNALLLFSEERAVKSLAQIKTLQTPADSDEALFANKGQSYQQIKQILDHNATLRRRAEVDYARQQHDFQDLKYKYDSLKILHEKALEGKRVAMVNHQYVSLELNEANERLVLLERHSGEAQVKQQRLEDYVHHQQKRFDILMAKYEELCPVDASPAISSRNSVETPLGLPAPPSGVDAETQARTKANTTKTRTEEEMKVKYDCLKRVHDKLVLDSVETNMVAASTLEEAESRYGQLKRKFDDVIESDPVAKNAEYEERVLTLENLNVALQCSLETEEELKLKLQSEVDIQGKELEEFRIKYRLLKESYGDGVERQQQKATEWDDHHQGLLEMKRKYKVLKVHFDSVVDDAEHAKHQKLESDEANQKLRDQFDEIKRKFDQQAVKQEKMEDAYEEQKRTWRAEQLCANMKLKLDQKTAQCSQQEDKIASTLSQIRVLEWMAPKPAEGQEAEYLKSAEPLTPLSSLHRHSDTQSSVAAQVFCHSISEAMEDGSSVFSNLSHDVRTPLTAAMSALTILLDDKVKLTEVDKRELTQKAFGSLQTVLNLVNTILDFERLRTNAITPNLKPVNVRRLAIHAIRSVNLQTINLEVILMVDSSVPTFVIGDRMLIGRVLSGLIENAIKASVDGGGLIVSLTWDAKDEALLGSVGSRSLFDQAETANFADWNTWRCDLTMNNNQGAANLRFAVCNQLLNEMGGHLLCQSNIDGHMCRHPGSAFRLRAPLSKNVTNSCSLTVKVVDPDPLRYNATVKMLKYAGANVFLGDSSTSMESELPSLVLVTADPANGFFRDATSQAGVPICALIPNHHPIPTGSLTRAAEQLGVDAVLRSPLDIVELRDMLNIFGDGCVYSDQSSGASSHATFTSATSDTVKEDILILLAEDVPLNHNLFLRQLSNMGFANVHSAFNGQEAVALAETNTYSLIIMDCQMPTLNGFQATERIRAMPHHQITPIIGVTADHSSENVLQAHRAGMTDVFAKPLSAHTWKNLLAHARPQSSTSFSQMLHKSSTSMLAIVTST